MEMEEKEEKSKKKISLLAGLILKLNKIIGNEENKRFIEDNWALMEIKKYCEKEDKKKFKLLGKIYGENLTKKSLDYWLSFSHCMEILLEIEKLYLNCK